MRSEEMVMLKPVVLIASLVVAGSLGWLAGHAAEEKEKEEGETHKNNKELAAEELALADRAIELGMEGFRASRIRLSDAQVERWSLRRIAALEAAGAKAEYIHKARVAHRDLMKSLEKLAESLFKSAQAAEIDYLEAKYARLEADRQLREEDGDNDENGRAQKNSDRKETTAQRQDTGSVKGKKSR